LETGGFMKVTRYIIGLWIAIHIVGRFVDINPYLWGVGIRNLHGQFYRYITETFLHVNWVHLIANCLALYFVTVYLNGKVSGLVIAVLGVFGSTATNIICSFLWKDAEHGMGGSTLIFALIGLILVMQVVCKTYAPFQLGTWYGNWTVGYVILGNMVCVTGGLFDISTVIAHGVAFAMGILLSILFYVCHVIA
jgi:membrane associated rhomboid family serine protease